MTKKIDKMEKEVVSRITLLRDLDSAKKELIIAKLSLADKYIRLFELQNSRNAANKSQQVPPIKVSSISPKSNPASLLNLSLLLE
jgi:hypothetical protein